jgi:hypothetical protein
MANTSSTGGYLTPTSIPVPEDDALDDTLQEVFVGLTGLDPSLVRPRWQPVDRKMPNVDVDWCAFGVTEDEPDADAVVQHVQAGTERGADKLQRTEVMRVMATFYGPNAKGYAKIARDGLYIPQNRSQLEIALLAVITTGTIRAVPEQINNQWVRRYDLPLVFRRTVQRTYAIESLESADVTLHIEQYTVNIKG